MSKKQNNCGTKQGLKAKDWFQCAHCKKDYKHARATGMMTCRECKKKGLNDKEAIEVAKELMSLKELQKEESEKDRCDAHEDTDFIFDFNWRKLPPELLRRKHIRKLLSTYSSLYRFTHVQASLQNKIVADFSNRKISEELSDKDKDRLINTILTGIRIREIKAGIIVVHSGLAPEHVIVLKEKAANKMPNAEIRFFVINKKHAGHTLINAIFFGNFQLPLDDDCC